MKTVLFISFVAIFSQTGLVVTTLEIKDSDVDFYFYSTSNPSQGIHTNISNASSVANTDFSVEKDTFFCIHGWMDTVSSNSCQLIKNSILEKHDINVFVVDWDRLAGNLLYPVIVAQIEDIGEWLGFEIQNLVNNTGLHLGTTTIVGHSLGAHIAGVAGKVLDGKLKIIVGLDPAGPLFTSTTSANILNTSSAQFVQIIHTCGLRLGYYGQLGHADYYPNGGRTQPMCSILDINGKCSHLISLDFYAESVLTGNFKARKCDSYNDYEDGKCDNAESSYMGEYDIDTQASGKYYLETNKASPYAKH